MRAGSHVVGMFPLPKKEIQGQACPRGVRTVPPLHPLPPSPEHCFPLRAFTDTQKMGVHCDPDHMAWVPPHCSRQGDSRLGGVGEPRLDTTRQNLLRCPHHSPTFMSILKMRRPRATGVLFHRLELSKPRDFRSSASRTPLSWIFA